MPKNFGFGGLRSGQCCDHVIIRPWEVVEMSFIPKVRVGARYLFQDICILDALDDTYAVLTQRPLLRVI